MSANVHMDMSVHFLLKSKPPTHQVMDRICKGIDILLPTLWMILFLWSPFCSVCANTFSQPTPQTIFSSLPLLFQGRTNSPFFPSIFPSFVHQCNCSLSRNRKELPRSVKELVVSVSIRNPCFWPDSEVVYTSNVKPCSLSFLLWTQKVFVVVDEFVAWTENTRSCQTYKPSLLSCSTHLTIQIG